MIKSNNTDVKYSLQLMKKKYMPQGISVAQKINIHVNISS